MSSIVASQLHPFTPPVSLKPMLIFKRSQHGIIRLQINQHPFVSVSGTFSHSDWQWFTDKPGRELKLEGGNYCVGDMNCYARNDSSIIKSNETRITVYDRKQCYWFCVQLIVPK